LKPDPFRGLGVALLIAVALSAISEVTEWWIAVLASPDTAEAYLGSQGDPWDAQKDMLLDTPGALSGLGLPTRAHDRALEEIA